MNEQTVIAFIAAYLYATRYRSTIKQSVEDAREIWEASQDEGDDDESDPILDGHSLGI